MFCKEERTKTLIRERKKQRKGKKDGGKEIGNLSKEKQKRKRK